MTTSTGLPLAMTASRTRTATSGGAPTHFAPVPRLVLLSWGALMLNVLTPGGAETIVPVPRALTQAIAQGSLLVALALALLANRRLVVRPHAVLVLLGVLALAAFVASLHNEFVVGSVYRGLRLLGFVAVLWLLSPWWGRRDLTLLRAHRLCLWVVLLSVVVGAIIAPGKAFAVSGRLGGTVWPIPPTQVAHYAAVLFGTTVILWMCHIVSGRHAFVAVAVTTAVLIGTHTRTALVGVLLGVSLAGASLFLGHARVRRVSASSVVGIAAAGVLFAPQLVTWLARGQTAGEASRLTGRTDVWTDVFAAPRPLAEQLFGTGLSNKSFDGLAIDSNWVATYVDQGWAGLLIEVAVLVVLLAVAATHVRGPRRALAIFLVVYCIVASVTEVGLGDASTYLLDLVVAGSLLAAAPTVSPSPSAAVAPPRGSAGGATPPRVGRSHPSSRRYPR